MTPQPLSLSAPAPGCRLPVTNARSILTSSITPAAEDRTKKRRRRERSVFARTDQLRRSATDDVVGLQYGGILLAFRLCGSKEQIAKNIRTSNERHRHPSTILCAVAEENNVRGRHFSELGVASAPLILLLPGHREVAHTIPCTTRGARAASGGGGDPRRRRRE